MCTIAPKDHFGVQRYELSLKTPNLIKAKKATLANI